MKTHISRFLSHSFKTALALAIAIPALFMVLPLLSAAPGAPAPRAPAPQRPVVDRSFHGSVRHAETHVEQRPTFEHREPEHHVEVHREALPHFDYRVHRDVDIDVHRHHHSDDFAFHRHIVVLPFGCLTLNIGGTPYYYDDGIYYQPVQGGYQEVYPPVGAAVPQPPDGSIQIEAGGQTYYYAGGAFYVQQPDGSFVIAPTPIGVVVPELPPGAIQVSAAGTIAYQFNGIYYRPVFVNGVTQYQTFQP